jgi:hypothetical protein
MIMQSIFFRNWGGARVVSALPGGPGGANATRLIFAAAALSWRSQRGLDSAAAGAVWTSQSGCGRCSGRHRGMKSGQELRRVAKKSLLGIALALAALLMYLSVFWKISH